ncbi:hypothetical protein HAX54_014177, partial [Datura stramonium]|nr:hypothetical protein [Datura stramonium]
GSRDRRALGFRRQEWYLPYCDKCSRRHDGRFRRRDGSYVPVGLIESEVPSGRGQDRGRVVSPEQAFPILSWSELVKIIISEHPSVRLMVTMNRNFPSWFEPLKLSISDHHTTGHEYESYYAGTIRGIHVYSKALNLDKSLILCYDT